MLALPKLFKLEQCAELGTTVVPYIADLAELPARIMVAMGLGDHRGAESQLDVYMNTNPFISGLALSLAIATVVFVVSEVNKNYSQVDRLWSLLPMLYTSHYAIWARLVGVEAHRVNLALAAVIIWGIRLTFNYWRKGGYEAGSEDYRWPVIRERLPSMVAFVFNIVFISLYQNLLIFGFTFPVYSMLLSSKFKAKITTMDLAFYVLELLLVYIEGTADQQQWEYHQAKNVYKKSGRVTHPYSRAELERGFLTRGLWKFSRHPNFACEQTFWFVLYLWSCYSCNVAYSWTGIGSILLIALFQGSTWLTELITADKYNQYAKYQNQVAKFIPFTLQGFKESGATNGQAKGKKTARSIEQTPGAVFDGTESVSGFQPSRASTAVKR